MNNIKTIEVIKSLPGLEIGDTLTRENADSNFELNVEEITESYSAKRFISISQSLLNKDEFKAIEWFKPVKTNKQRIAELEGMLEAAEKAYKNEVQSYYELEKMYNTIFNRVSEKIDEFSKKYDEVAIEAKGTLSGERMLDIDEAMTVYYNMIDLLRKVIA